MEQRRRIAAPGAMGALRAHPTIAITTIIALVATMAFGGNSIYQAQSEGGNPIPVAEQTLNFGSGDNVVVEDAAIASQGGVPGPKTVKEFTSESEFSMFALTWNEKDPEFATYVRAENADGEWGPWYAAAPMEEVSANGKRGTDLIYVEPTNRVQVSVAGVDLGITDEKATDADAASLVNVPDLDIPVAGTGAATTDESANGQGGPVEPVAMPDEQPDAAPEQEPEPVAAAQPETKKDASTGLPAIPSNYGDIQPVADSAEESAGGLSEETGPISADSIETVLIDPNLGAGLNSGIDLMATTDGMPPVISRQGWGANEAWRHASYNPPVTAVTVHHTAGSNNYSESQAPGVVRGIHQYHASTLGWGDVGYNALVDKYGNIYEGRAGGLDRAVQGAHVGGFNANTWGISLLGDYESASPSQAAVTALGQIAGWKAAISDFDPTGSSYHSADFNFRGSRYSAGQGATFPNINAHRDFHYNTCPGGNLYAQMGTIRSIAKERYNQIKSGTAGTSPTTSQPTATKAPSQPTTTTTAPQQQTTTTKAPTQSEPTQEQTTSAANTPIDLIMGALGGDTTAIISIVGSLAALLLTAAASQGATAEGSSTVGDVEVVGGLTVADLPPIISGIVSLTGDSEIERTWATVNETFGPVLGNSRSGEVNTGQGGPQTPIDFALFDNGIIVSDDNAGTHALWGAMADAWAGQGFDIGPLGMPTSNPHATGNGGELKVDFEGGTMTFDPNTNKVNISTY